MTDFMYQLISLMLLGGALWAGYQRWIRPRPLDRKQQGMLFLILLTGLGGAIGAFFWWWDVEQSFAWDLPPLASRMLAAAGLAFAAVAVAVLERPTARRTRLVIWMLLVYLLPLALAVVLLHLDRFDAKAPITYAFFVIVVFMTCLAGWYTLYPSTILADDTRQASGQATRLWLGAVGVLTALWGLALFLSDDGGVDLIWVWGGDLLSSQLIGVMLLTIAAGVGYGVRYVDTARLMLLVTAVYGLGLCVASLWNALDDKPIKESYAVVFGVIFLGSSFLWWWRGER